MSLAAKSVRTVLSETLFDVCFALCLAQGSWAQYEAQHSLSSHGLPEEDRD